MRLWKYIFIFLLLILSGLVIAIFQLPDGNLHIIACDVGQGDAILVIYKNIQILTDGGPDNKVIGCLGRHLPFWDRTIELVISTHPDADHSTGLIDVIKKYNAPQILINPIDPGTQVYKALEKEVGGKGVHVINPTKGMTLGVDMIQLDILSPSENLKSQNSNLKTGQTNLFSIVYLLNYGHFRAFMPGDAPPAVLDELATGWSMGTVNYIKIPHHGSANGLTENLLKALMPKVAVISVSAKNIWGFPAPEIIEMLNKYGVKTLRTDQIGDVIVSTDGDRYWVGN